MDLDNRFAPRTSVLKILSFDSQKQAAQSKDQLKLKLFFQRHLIGLVQISYSMYTQHTIKKILRFETNAQFAKIDRIISVNS